MEVPMLRLPTRKELESTIMKSYLETSIFKLVNLIAENKDRWKKEFADDARVNYVLELEKHFFDLNNVMTIGEIVRDVSTEPMEQQMSFLQTVIRTLNMFGISTYEITRKSIDTYELIGKIEQKSTRKTFKNLYLYGDNPAVKFLMDFMEGKEEIFYDFEGSEYNGNITIENGLIIYHLPKSLDQSTDENDIVRQTLVLNHLIHLKQNGVNDRQKKVDVLESDILLGKMFFDREDDNFIKKYPELYMLTVLYDLFGKEKL